jgi:hypothetical protein
MPGRDGGAHRRRGAGGHGRWGITNYNHAEEYRKLRSWLTDRFNYLDRIIRNYPTH